MKLLFDLFPVILFFVTYKMFSPPNGGNACLSDQVANLPWTHEPILIATTVAIVATLVQVGWVKHRHGKVDTMLWISAAIITIMGGATLYFHNAAFIQWKPTILYWCIASALVAAPIITGRNLIRAAMEEKIPLPEHLWGKVNIAWALFFFGIGLANIAAVRFLSCNDWVNFKVFGITAFMIVFIIAQAIMLSKYVEEDKKEEQ